MKKYLCITGVVLLMLLTGCGAKMPNGAGIASQIHHEEGGSSAVSSQSHHDAISVAFMNSMDCNDKNCTDASHYHHCSADCTDYDHYHNCSLDCTETSHHHSRHTAESSHKEQQHSTTSHHSNDSHH